MIENLPEDKLEALIERVVSKSHMAIAKVQSNGLGDLKRQLEELKISIVRFDDKICAGFDKVTARQDIANGRTTKNESRIDTLSGVVNEIKGDEKSAIGWIKGVGITIGIILVLSATIFELRLSAVSKLSSDTQEMLVSHVKSANDYLKTLK